MANTAYDSAGHTVPETDSAPRESGMSAWPLFLLLAIAVASLVVLQYRRPRERNEWVGQKMPPIEAVGWLNADRPPSNESLRGKLVLVDYWETGCIHCVNNMPDLVKLKDKYAGRVAIVGLTPEYDGPLGQLSRYVTSVRGLDWPIGYGAGVAFQMAGIQFLPTYVLYNGDGRAIWGGHRLSDLEDVLVAELAKG